MRIDTSNPHKTTAPTGQTAETTAETPEITGPHVGRDPDGAFDHHYYRCERCGLESTDPRLQAGCFRCGARNAGDDRG